MSKKKQKKRGVFLKNSKQKEGIEKYDPSEGKGLKLQWLNFISNYIKNGGNATEAYLIAYPKSSEESARRSASDLLTNPDIIGEISNRYDQQTITEAWVIANAKEYVLAGLNDSKFAYAGVKALEMIAKSKGMLTDNHKFEFTSENPAIVPPVVSSNKAKELNKIIIGGGVIE